MKFGEAYPATAETYGRDAFHLAPTARAVTFSQTRHIPNGTADGNDFHVGYFPNDVKG
jgi:hypothetical protein